MKRKMVIGTRQSKLALAQTNWVMQKLQRHYPQVSFEIQKIVTKGDVILDVTLNKIGGKGLFVSEVEQSLINKEIDFAVHSMKDVPADLMEGLTIGAIPKRESPYDVLVFKEPNTFMNLKKEAIIGTSSLRRAAQIQKIRSDINIKPIRGNIDTRLRKLQEENFDAIILAEAGLKRMGFLDEGSKLNYERLDEKTCLPAVGQGALAIECRNEDAEIKAMLATIHHYQTAICVEAERAFLKKIDGGCGTPIAGFAQKINDSAQIEMHALIADPNGKIWLEKKQRGYHAEEIGASLAKALLGRGAGKIIAEHRIDG